MGGIFGGGPEPAVAPAPKPLPPAPDRTDAQTQALADEQRKRFSGSTGRAANFFTAGGTTQAATAVRYLGGAAKT